MGEREKKAEKGERMRGGGCAQFLARPAREHGMKRERPVLLRGRPGRSRHRWIKAGGSSRAVTT